MFSVEDRESLRAELIQMARSDERITGAALIGSAATGAEDRWSDIDLSFGVRSEAEIPAVLQAFTDWLFSNHEVVDTLDSVQSRWLQRVFLMADTLQVDLAFTAANGFRAEGPAFSLLFGKAIEAKPIRPPNPEDVIGRAWLYALRVRSSLAREKPWQAEFMVRGMRDQALILACLRCGLPPSEGRGIDALPMPVRRGFEETLVRSIDRRELVRAFHASTDLLLEEIRLARPALYDLLEQTLRLLGASITDS
jgi:hypothetical protein